VILLYLNRSGPKVQVQLSMFDHAARGREAVQILIWHSQVWREERTIDVTIPLAFGAAIPAPDKTNYYKKLYFDYPRLVTK